MNQPPVQPAPTQPATRQQRKGFSGLFIFLGVAAFLVLVGTCAVFVWDTFDRRAQEEERQKQEVQAQQAQALVAAIEKRQRELITEAESEGRVIVGMTKYDVERSIGEPEGRVLKSKLPEALVKQGGFELWSKNTSMGYHYAILFNVDGEVIFVKDYAAEESKAER